MKIKHTPFDISRVVSSSGGLGAKEPHARAAGLHLTEIIRDIENRTTYNGQRRHRDDLTTEERKRLGSYAAVGFLWEQVIEDYLAARMTWARRDQVSRQFEIELDGVWMSPDAFDTNDWCLEEYKATWKSSRRLTEGAIEVEFWHWVTQIKAYCKALGCTRARLFIFFVCGDYRESGPQCFLVEFEFTQQELDENWAMLLNHARQSTSVKHDAARPAPKPQPPQKKAPTRAPKRGAR